MGLIRISGSPALFVVPLGGMGRRGRRPARRIHPGNGKAVLRRMDDQCQAEDKRCPELASAVREAVSTLRGSPPREETGPADKKRRLSCQGDLRCVSHCPFDTRETFIVTDENPLRVAAALAQAGKTPEAITCLESTLVRTRSNNERPANTSTLARTAGLLCEKAGRLPQAAVYYEEAAATADHDPFPLLALASVRWQLGQSDSACSCLTRAESLAQASADADALKIVARFRADWASTND